MLGNTMTDLCTIRLRTLVNMKRTTKDVERNRNQFSLMNGWPPSSAKFCESSTLSQVPMGYLTGHARREGQPKAMLSWSGHRKMASIEDCCRLDLPGHLAMW